MATNTYESVDVDLSQQEIDDLVYHYILSTMSPPSVEVFVNTYEQTLNIERAVFQCMVNEAAITAIQFTLEATPDPITP